MRATWSLYHECCSDCSTTERRHVGHGLCQRCYRRRLRAGSLPERSERPWSSIADACRNCGGTDRKHVAHGLCGPCHQVAYRATDRGQEIMREACRRYAASPHGRRRLAEYSRRRLQMPDVRENNRRNARIWRDRDLGLTAAFPLGYEELVYEVFGERCISCGVTSNLVLDHHRPLQGGHALLHNAVLLCRSCNWRKGSSPPEDFYDPSKLAEISMLLAEARTEFERRFDAGRLAS